jgi:hypothetical protein
MAAVSQAALTWKSKDVISSRPPLVFDVHDVTAIAVSLVEDVVILPRPSCR